MASLLKELTGYKQSLEKPALMPKAVLLDINGTVFNVNAAQPVFRELGIDPELVELWFARLLRDAFGAQAAGLFRPFKDIGAYHLDVMLRSAGRDSRLTGVEAMKKVIDSWSQAPLYPDVPDALRLLHNANIKVCALTNGSAELVAMPVLSNGGVLQLCKEHLLDINMAQCWKPFRSSYAYAAKQLGLPEDCILMIASHPWDIAGAMQAGLRGVYIQRDPAEVWPDYLPAPDYVLDSFAGLADLLGLQDQADAAKDS